VELMDDLSYRYTGNKLNKVDDASGNYAGYPSPSGNPMTYDNNGNMTSHLDKGILQIDYNYLNLPNYVKFYKEYVSHDFRSTYYVNTKYLYNAGGIKLRKIHTYGSGKTDIETIDKTDYLDGFQYWGDELSFVSTPEGYYDFKKNTYIYNYTDQLGNIRLAYYKDASGTVKVDRTTHYYPFGLEFGGQLNTSNSITPNYTYSSQGQEKQIEAENMSKNNIDDIFQMVRFNESKNLSKTVNETNVNQFVNEFGQNLLHEAVAYDSLEILKYLLSCNIEINKQDNEGKTPLHYSVDHNNYDFTKLLLTTKGIEKNIKDQFGNNAMWTAVFNSDGGYDIVKLLKEYGFDSNSKNNHDRSPLDLAKQIEDEKLQKILTSK